MNGNQSKLNYAVTPNILLKKIFTVVKRCFGTERNLILDVEYAEK